MSLRKLKEAEWQAFKRIRLEALRESPFAFGRTFEEESQLTNLEWQRRTARYAHRDGTHFLMFWLKEQPIGIAGCFRSEEKTKTSHLFFALACVQIF